MSSCHSHIWKSDNLLPATYILFNVVHLYGSVKIFCTIYFCWLKYGCFTIVLYANPLLDDYELDFLQDLFLLHLSQAILMFSWGFCMERGGVMEMQLATVFISRWSLSMAIHLFIKFFVFCVFIGDIDSLYPIHCPWMHLAGT